MLLATLSRVPRIKLEAHCVVLSVFCREAKRSGANHLANTGHQLRLGGEVVLSVTGPTRGLG